MAGAERQAAGLVGQVSTIAGPPGVLVVAIRGFMTFATVSEALARASVALADDADARGVVFDLSHVDGFLPGIPAKIVQWTHAQRARIRALGFVTTSVVWTATIRAATFMVPDTTFFSASNLREAYASMGGLLGARSRSATGTRPKIF